MVVLALNCGSSSLKFQVLDTAGKRSEPLRVVKGLVERIGGSATVTLDRQGRPSRRETATIPDHDAAVRLAIEEARGAASRLDGVGHRVVHGGERYVRSVIIDAAVDAALEELETLAPLHNRPSLVGIRASRAALGPSIPNVAVFDTAFHSTLPERAWRYAIDRELSSRHHIRRFGFHGISYQAVLSRYCHLTRTSASEATLVALHLGNGASATAIKNGCSIDTSMGFTPLEGLVMGTRSGDLDPALVGYLARRERVSVDEVERWLNERSGLSGLSGGSRDMRDLLDRQREDERARLAVEIFCYRARKYLGAYLAALGGAPAVVFSGGIGEHSSEVRERICEEMQWCGLILDSTRNVEADGREARISADGARIHAWVIPTDEERVIAQETFHTLTP